MHQYSHDVVTLLLSKLVLKIITQSGNLDRLTKIDMGLETGPRGKAHTAKIVDVPADDKYFGKYKWIVLIRGSEEKAEIYFNEDGEHEVFWDSPFPPALYNEKIPKWMLLLARCG